MTLNYHPFVMAQSHGMKVERGIPRSLSYINDLYRNVQLAEGFGVPGPKSKLTNAVQLSSHLPRTQSTGSTSCDPALRTIMRRRAKSLPSSPERKLAIKCRPKCHKVRFADSLGLELAEVKVFNSTDNPFIPLHVLSRLSINSDLCCSQDLEFSIQYLEPDFHPPKEQGDFLDRLQQHCVCLEQATSSEEQGISGTICVLNLAFEKSVSVRYSFTDWKNYYEVKAMWQKAAKNISPNADVFAFTLTLPPYLQHICPAIQFAVRYQVAGKEYWDNNLGTNYTFTYRSHSLKMPKECEQSWIHFI
ncbi:hypothetical protein GDO86_014572 [Hymenochirus boettgeri]|uniref:CBM21 domain-containing protein n=1 Tax=Hymenochirus boettgeri TaxID=247094 RepID=A0A8T2JUQ7_9PIPI|nr:hypothetical protein GDO86_014572 [Hymenochirus boettgeri]